MVLIGERYKEKLAQSLAPQGIEPIWLPDDPALDPRLAGHADLLAFASGRRIVLAESLFHSVPYGNTGIVNYLTNIGYSVMPTRSTRGTRYPADVGLCVCDTGKYTIYCSSTIDDAVRALIGGVPVTVAQGYAKCAACVVDDHSIITADAGVSRAAKSAGMDVLDITAGHVALDGYDYGFIGGAAFKIRNDTLAFTGTLDAHPDKERILRFLADRGQMAVFLTDEPIFDIGGAITLEALP